MRKTAETFLKAVAKYNPIAICILGSPDPDAIAAAFAIKLILNRQAIDADIFAEKQLSLSQNKAFAGKLKIPIYFGQKIDLAKYQAYLVPDFQTNRVEQIGDAIPCVAHLDHHCQQGPTVKADFSLIRTDAGATSTLVALMIKSLNPGFSEEEMTALATALTFGIQTDTDKYNNITELDFEALSYLSAYVDWSVLQGLNSMPLSPETLNLYSRAKQNGEVYREWAFYGLGFIDARHRDSIAVIADMLLKNSDHKLVAVFAVIENHKEQETYLDVSLRSNNSAVDLNRIIKNITPNGGGRKYKGAYQIKLNYLKHTPDKDLLWQVVETATRETLRKNRDALYMTGIKSFYGRLKDKLRSIITGERK